MRTALAHSAGRNRKLVNSSLVWALVGCLLLGMTIDRPASAFTPESPEVKRLLDKAVKYLETADDNRLGGKCLIGMVFVKMGKKDDHPKIKAAIDACKAICQGTAADIKEDVYSTGIATVFLCDVDASKYRPEIVKLMGSLELRQRAEGGWGYPLGGAHGDSGDTSMTQYAVLASWSCYRNDVGNISQDSVERVCNWLLRTQDPSGGFGYQGVDPGVGRFTRVNQHEVKNSLSAAGAGSLYICADLLKFKVLADAVEKSDEIPEVLELVEEGNAKVNKGPITEKVPSKVMMKGLSDTNAWFARNYKIDQGSWNLYHMYALERYMSFRELADNIKDEEPKWYNDGVRHLTKTQTERGTWEAQCGESVDTAFGALFLMRSTKKAIQKSLKKFGDGQLTGGRGLPTNAAEVAVKHGKIVNAASASAQLEDLVALLEEGEGSSFEYLTNNPEEFKLAEDETQRKEQVLRLRRLVAASAYESRLVAVRALGRSRDFESVPSLIYALTDPDARVVREADTSLRYIARRFGESKLPSKLSDDDKKALAAEWTKWYASVRPDADIK